ncbi:MAG: Pentacotripeptide-repeat region of, partial [Chlamydiota bacterium]
MTVGLSRKRPRSPFPETCPITTSSRVSSKICEFLVPPFNTDPALSKRICAQLRTKRYNLEEGIQLVQQLGGNGGNKFIYSSLIQLDAPFECKALMFTLITSKPNLADAFTYASFIKTTGNCKDLETAKEAFEKAKQLGLADAVTYASFIKAAGDLGDLQAAKEAFEKAKQLGLADAVTYASFIKAAGDLGDLQAAKEAFEEA